MEILGDWFTPIRSHIFLSHSHDDEEMVKQLAGYLKHTYGIECFIDSCVWGYANDLLKEIDNRYCRYQETDGQFFYEYDNRNRSTSHVHMLLNGALAKMINKTECLFFINTPNSVNAQDVENPSKTASPWIYSELLINNASNNKKSPFIKRMYPQIKSNTISMSLPFVSEEDKVKENDIYLRMGTTNQLELIMLDSAGRIQRYYILVEPNVKSANKTEKIEKKVKKVNENGNDSKYYSAGTAELNYTLVTSPNIVFECNLINPETIDNYIESYKEEVSDIKYGEDISGEKIYDNMVKINDLVKTQLF